MVRIPQAERRELLLAAAFRVMAEHGVAAATTRAVCAEAGMPLASFHYVFESQQDLMAQLIQTLVELESGGDLALQLTDDPVADITHLLLSSFEFVRQHPGEEQAILELGHYALRTPGMEGLVTARAEAGLEVIRGRIARLAAHHGEVQVDVEELAQLALTVMEGITMVWLAARDDDSARRSLRTFGTCLASIMFDGQPA